MLGVTGQFFMKNGFQTLVNKLISAILEMNESVEFLKNSNVYRIEKLQRNNFVYFGDVQKNVIHRLETSKIFLCFPFGVFETVPIYENKCLSSYLKIQNIYKQHLANSSVLKIFVQVSDPLWGKLRGKPILSSIFNQLYFYSQDSLLLNLVGEDADIYQAYFGAEFQKNFMNFDSLYQKLEKLLAARLHSLTEVLHNPKRCAVLR
jgi:hypothetical protein